jgi:hypothetical protein
MEEKTSSALMNYYLRRVIAKMVIPKPARAKRAHERNESHSR